MGYCYKPSGSEKQMQTDQLLARNQKLEPKDDEAECCSRRWWKYCCIESCMDCLLSVCVELCFAACHRDD
uniref:CYSTM domain-containing protein n=1 Tax=Bursaphelenchus xylophilus TaxID=6326 RepID=A0A1I7RXL3_BURXY